MKTIPVLFKSKQTCCGCAACFAICKNDAISMQPDEEGFYYPVIEDSKCVRCYQCFIVCPMHTE